MHTQRLKSHEGHANLEAISLLDLHQRIQITFDLSWKLLQLNPQAGLREPGSLVFDLDLFQDSCHK